MCLQRRARPSIRRAWRLLVLLLFWPANVPSAEGPAILLRDINAVSDPEESSYPDLFVSLDGLVYFTSYTKGGLYRTDGTPAGTRQVVSADDIGGSALALTVFEGRIFFFTYRFELDVSLWSSDGTAAGTTLVKRLPGGLPTSPSLLWMENVNGVLIFPGKEESDLHLWRSDGTAGGTVPLRDADPAPGPLIDAFSQTPRILAGDLLYFMAIGGEDYGFQLWRTDGTDAGTRSVADVGFSGGAAVSDSHTIVFAGGVFPGPYGWWRSDGTREGTTLIVEGVTYGLMAVPQGNGVLFSIDDGIHGSQLWRTDGTIEGTTRITDVEGDFSPYGGFSFDGAVYFCDSSGTQPNLWRSDGTPAGTRRVFTDSDPGCPLAVLDAGLLLDYDSKLYVTDGASKPILLKAGVQFGSAKSFGSRVFLSGNDGLVGSEPWVSDGTAEGTHLVADVAGSSGGSNPMAITPLGDSVLFWANDGRNGFQLWRARGKEAELVRQIVPGPNGIVAPLVTSGGLTYFSAPKDGEGLELWRTDGTDAGTVRVRDIVPGEDSSAPRAISPYGSGVVFGTSNGEIWRSDGSEQGTALVSPIGPYTDWPSFVVNEDRLFIFASQPGGTCKLWASQGHPDDTAPIGDFGRCSPLPAAGGHLFFWIYDSTGADLWTSDGTAGGATPIAHFITNQPVNRFFVYGNRLAFIAGGGSRKELWISDGTAAGTISLGMVHPSSGSADFARLADRFFFSADTSFFAGVLWSSDGTSAGTGTPLSELMPEPRGIRSLAALGDRLYFDGYDDGHGSEPWVSDGTAAGTHRLQEIVPGTDSSDPSQFVGAGTNIYFVARDPRHGDELWVLPCAGDCGADGDVEPGDVQNAVEIALGRAPMSTCPPVNFDAGETITVDDIVRAAANAAHGCPIF